jgi:hypothetical protein
MPRQSVTDRNSPSSADVWLSRAWWGVFPPFAVLVGRLTYERACADPYGLLQALSSTPATAWPLAVVYVGAHAWMMAVYLRLVARTNQFLPGLAQIHAARRPAAVKVVLMAVVLAAEFSPVSLWRLVGASACAH